MPIPDLHLVREQVLMPPVEASVGGSLERRWGGLLSPEGVNVYEKRQVSPDAEIEELLGGARQTEVDHTTEYAPVLSSFCEKVPGEEVVKKPVPVSVNVTQECPSEKKPQKEEPDENVKFDELKKWSQILETQHGYITAKRDEVDAREIEIRKKEIEVERVLKDARNSWGKLELEGKERELNIRELNLKTAVEEIARKDDELLKKSNVVEQRARDAQELFSLLEDKSRQINAKVDELREREDIVQRQERFNLMRERDLMAKKEQMERFQSLMSEKVNKIEETRVELSAWNRDLDQRERLLQMRSSDVEETEKSLSDLSVEVKQQQRVLETKISVLRHLERTAKMPAASDTPSWANQSTARVLDLDTSDTFDASQSEEEEDTIKEDIVRETSSSVSPTAPNVATLPTPRPAPLDDPAADVLNSTDGSTNVYDID